MSTERKAICPLVDDCTWKEWSQHILAELVRLNDGHEGTLSQLREIQVDLAKLKIRSSIWGGLMGACSTALLAIGLWLWEYLRGGVK
jgi:hypothetical protein